MEALVATAIFGLVLVGVCTLYTKGATVYNRGEEKVEVHQNARIAINVVARELRHAGYDPSNAIGNLATTAIEVAGANTVTFIADVDGDQISNRVRYRLQGTRLIRENSSWDGANFPAFSGGGELAEGVSALSFAYYDDSDSVTTTLADMRRVKIEITAQGTTAGMQATLPLTTDVRLRNLQ